MAPQNAGRALRKHGHFWDSYYTLGLSPPFTQPVPEFLGHQLLDPFARPIDLFAERRELDVGLLLGKMRSLLQKSAII